MLAKIDSHSLFEFEIPITLNLINSEESNCIVNFSSKVVDLPNGIGFATYCSLSYEMV